MKKGAFGGCSKYAQPSLAAKRTGQKTARVVTSCAALAKGRVSAGTQAIGAQASSMKATSFFGSSVMVAASGSTARRTPRGTGSGKLVTKAMFERFTEKAIKVVMLAQEEVRTLFSFFPFVGVFLLCVILSSYFLSFFLLPCSLLFVPSLSLASSSFSLSFFSSLSLSLSRSGRRRNLLLSLPKQLTFEVSCFYLSLLLSFVCLFVCV